MTITLRFFATLKTRFRADQKEVTLDRSKTAREIFEELFDSPEDGARFLPFTRFAVNCEYVPPETVVRPGDELAFIPPVSGG
ncbi:MAG TPA: MoaD/ThiS family protein [bacterium]|nr:MoaD/ThiS family protein [bacterium]